MTGFPWSMSRTGVKPCLMYLREARVLNPVSGDASHPHRSGLLAAAGLSIPPPLSARFQATTIPPTERLQRLMHRLLVVFAAPTLQRCVGGQQQRFTLAGLGGCSLHGPAQVAQISTNQHSRHNQHTNAYITRTLVPGSCPLSPTASRGL